MTSPTATKNTELTRAAKWFWYIAVFAAAVAATAYVTQTHPVSQPVLYLIGTTYGTYLVVNFALTLPVVFKTPHMRSCFKHWRYQMPDSLRWISRVATILCPTTPFWATNIIMNGTPDLATSIFATIFCTAAVAAVSTRFHNRAMQQQFNLHRLHECPTRD